MNRFRVLLLSNTRPSRSWRFARRIVREVPGVVICGIAQRPVSQLPLEQQWIATGQHGSSDGNLWRRLSSQLRPFVETLLHRALWFVHGCPPHLNVQPQFTSELLAAKCEEQDWPVLDTNDLGGQSVADFVSALRPDLVIALGEVPSLPETVIAPSCGWIRARSNDVLSNVANNAHGLRVRIEHLSRSSGSPQDLASLTLPRQVNDSAIGFTLKADLVVDDMLAHAAAGMQAGGAWEAADQISRWIEDIVSPYLAQLGPSKATLPPFTRLWYRSVWSLSVETILLCSPLIVFRNWVRRLRSRYPVLILVHHLVSDRAHRMSISTETFWRQVLFLRRHYQLVSLSDACEILSSGHANSPVVSLTFDDGYADNFISLRAVAEEVGVPVSLFITTQPIEMHQEFQHDLTRGQYGAFPMTWSQIRYWKHRGAEFGTHTRTHIKCGIADRATLQEEIVGSKTDFENQLGETPRFFAFPYGNRQDLPPEAVEIAASAYPHFLSAFGGENVTGKGQRNSHLFRKNAYPEPWELELELQSIFDIAESVKRAFRAARYHTSTPSRGQATPDLRFKRTLNFGENASHLLSEPSQAGQRFIKPS